MNILNIKIGRPSLKNNIGYLFVTYILIFSSFAALLSTTVQLFFEYKRDIGHIEKTVDQIEKSHKATIVQALWAYDIYILEMQIQGIKNLPDVSYVCIRKDDKIIIETGTKTSDKKFLSYEFPLLHKPRKKQLQLGTLKVKISLSAVYQRLWDRVIIILLTQTLKTFFVSIFIFFLFYSIVGRHLKAMAGFARSIHLRNLHNPLVLKRKTYRNNNLDELSLVESALNSMRLNLINEMDNVRTSQEALKKSEERFKSLVTNIPGIVYRRKLLPVWKVDYISEPIKNISGYPAQDFLDGDVDFVKIIYEKDLKKVAEKLTACVAKGESFEIEYRILHKNGSLRNVMEKGKAIYDTENKPLWLDGVILDITEKKKAEQQLNEKDLLLHSVIENTTDAVFFKDVEGRYIMANTSALKAIGQPESKVIGKTDFDLFPEESARIIKKIDSKVMASGKSLIAEEYLETAYGKTYWQANKSPLVDYRGNCIGLIGISRNINDLKLIQMQNEELEKKLLQAQKLESIGNLAGGIAHDFNNILFPIIGMAELLLEDIPRNTQEYENARAILRAGIRAGELVKQILAFSRKSEKKLVPVRIQKIIAEVLHLARATIPTDIEINHDIQHDCGLIMADPTQIHQVVMNIITNAFHALESKGGKIIVQLKEIAQAPNDLIRPVNGKGPYILLSVTDTGHGISPDAMNKIFEPYFTTKEQGKGTGLGLSVVYGIIQNLNGDIKVKSELGKGTSFNIYLPVIDNPAGLDTNDKIKKNCTGNEHVLLVDDEEGIVWLEKQLLEKLGYKVTFCTSSPDALEIFQTSPDQFDIVISDMTMPKITGDQLAKKLLSVRPDIPIIICTGFSEKIDRKTSTLLGIKGFLMKPVSIHDLAEMVRKTLDDADAKSL